MIVIVMFFIRFGFMVERWIVAVSTKSEKAVDDLFSITGHLLVLHGLVSTDKLPVQGVPR